MNTAPSVPQADLLDRCAQEPLHIIGSIQPHGVLFALSEPDMVVRQVSANVAESCGISAEDLLGRSFELILGKQQFDSFCSQIDHLKPIHVTIGKAKADAQCMTHRQDGQLLVELELGVAPGPVEHLDIDTHIRSPLLRIQQAANNLDLARIAAIEFRQLTGFERVILYQFEADWSGNVIAESVDASPVAYLGMRFPASDIPPQVRKLLLINPLQAISNARATAVPILPFIHPLTGRPLDLTRAFLRSASPTHLEHLSNMGVQSSLAISIVVEGRLWGMISCHHSSPRRIDCFKRSICELWAQLIGSHIAIRAESAALELKLQGRRLIENFMAHARNCSPFLDAGCFVTPVLLELFDADGLIACINGCFRSFGSVVEKERFLAAIETLQGLSVDGISSFEKLSELDVQAASYAAMTSGVLYIGLDSGSGDYLLLFRRELVQNIVWAGNPTPHVRTDAKDLLHPRGSFDTWEQTIRGSSRPWSRHHLNQARLLREQLLQLIDAQALHPTNASLYREIVAHERTELLLKKGAERLALAVRAGAVGIWEWDLAIDQLLWDDQMYRLYGLTRSREAEPYQVWLNGVHPDDRQRADEEMAAAIQGRKEFDTEFRVVWPDGETHAIRAMAMVQRNGSGTPLRMIGTNWDITHHKKADEQSARLREAVLQLELEKANDMYRFILDAVGEGIYGLDSQGRTTFVNPAALTMLGYSATELIGRLQHPVIHHSYADGSAFPIQECSIHRALQDGKAHHSDTEVFWRKDGSSFPISYTCTPILREGGTDGVVVTFRETSEKRRREAADAANKAKSDFLANMSHEIRTPMNGVLGMVQLTLLSELSDEQRHFLEVAQNSGRALLAIIDDILDISKIEAGKVVLEKLEFNLCRELEDVAEIWRIQAAAKKLAFSVAISLDTPTMVQGDCNRLRQILNNLASNAIKFTASGEIALNVALVNTQDGHAMVRFAVTDTGIGLRSDQAERLFSPFVQADVSTTRKFGGSGLGLAISKHLAELMGGSIGVESSEGRGATFWFTVVLEVASAVPADRSPKVDSSAQRTGHIWSRERAGLAAAAAGTRQSARILIAEDNATNRLVAMAQLQKLGYQSEAVVNGAEAVKAQLNTPYDLILMDCEMPIMDGLEATIQIRALSARRVPIIALTAQVMAGDRERCLRAGMDDFLSKPVDMGKLGDMLAKWGEKVESSRPAASPSHTESTAMAPIFDSEGLLNRLMGDRCLADMVMASFLDNFASQMTTMSQRFCEKDAPGACMEAHALRGAAATVSAVRLSVVALGMELAAGAGNFERFGDLLSQAAKEFACFEQRLTEVGWR